jgi:hypothetical protein
MTRRVGGTKIILASIMLNAIVQAAGLAFNFVSIRYMVVLVKRQIFESQV